MVSFVGLWIIPVSRGWMIFCLESHGSMAKDIQSVFVIFFPFTDTYFTVITQCGNTTKSQNHEGFPGFFCVYVTGPDGQSQPRIDVFDWMDWRYCSWIAVWLRYCSQIILNDCIGPIYLDSYGQKNKWWGIWCWIYHRKESSPASLNGLPWLWFFVLLLNHETAWNHHESITHHEPWNIWVFRSLLNHTRTRFGMWTSRQAFELLSWRVFMILESLQIAGHVTPEPSATRHLWSRNQRLQCLSPCTQCHWKLCCRWAEAHERLKARGLLVEFEQNLGKAAFLSQQWAAKHHPDPHFAQFSVFQDTMKNILSNCFQQIPVNFASLSWSGHSSRSRGVQTATWPKRSQASTHTSQSLSLVVSKISF